MEILKMNKEKCEPQAGERGATPDNHLELQVFEEGGSSSRQPHGPVVVGELKERTARTELKAAQIGLVVTLITAILGLSAHFGFTFHGDAKTVQEAPSVVVNNYCYNVVHSVFNAYTKEGFDK